MRTRKILSEGWRVREVKADGLDVAALAREAAAPDDNWLPATMPAQVHDVLLAHGRIPDPHVGRNAAASAWVGERDWAYACRFASPVAAGGAVLLRFGGLDTLAKAYLNGRLIGSFEDMFREYAVDVRDALAPAGADNVLLVVFSSPLRYAEQVKLPPEQVGKISKHKYLRKCFSDFSSYLGARPHSVKVGIYRDVVLDVPDGAWMEDVWVRSELSKDRARATMRAEVACTGRPAEIAWTLVDPDGKEAARGTRPTGCAGTDIEIPLADPKLWWPWTHGVPHLYRLRLRLTVDGREVDGREVAFGVRDVRVVLADPESGEKRFGFEINGRPIFLRGANWVPVEGATHCWRRDRAVRLLDLAQQGRMNALRVWGEGHVPPQEFYDECDRRGILVWQDFMFGYGMHPSGAPRFDAACRAEIEELICRLRSHACLLLWCGGNENYMGWDFQFGTAPAVGRDLFEKIMPEACARLDPSRHFHPSSPYGGPRPNWPLEGDWHDYTTLTFSPEASVPCFASEVGRVSAPPAASLRRFMSEEELWPAGHDPAIRKPGAAAWPPAWQHRSVDGSWDKAGEIEEFCDARSAEELVRVLGTAHGEYLRRRVERQRRGTPDGGPDGSRRCWGNLIWRLNDAWPILYWSAIDYYLQPKIAYYFLRRAYAPVLVCFEQTADRVAAWIVNDSPEPVGGRLEVSRLRFDGQALGRLRADVEVAAGQAKRCLVLTDFGPVNLRGEFLLAKFREAEAVHLFAGERHLHLPRAKVTARRVAGGVEVATDVFARQVAFEFDGASGAVFEDNYFDLRPGGRRTVAVVGPADGDEAAVRAVNAEPVTLRL